MDDAPTFTIGITSLKSLAEQKGWKFEVSEDGREERVIRPDGVVVARAKRRRTDT